MPATRSSVCRSRSSPGFFRTSSRRAPSVHVVPSSETEEEDDDEEGSGHEQEQGLACSLRSLKTRTRLYSQLMSSQPQPTPWRSRDGPSARQTTPRTIGEPSGSSEAPLPEPETPSSPRAELVTHKDTPRSITSKRKRDAPEVPSECSSDFDDSQAAKRQFTRTSSNASTVVDDQHSDTDTVNGDVEENELVKDKTTYPHVYAHARALLRCGAQVGQAGPTLVGRQQERQEITSFLENRLSRDRSRSSGSATPGALYIAGTPGTGKTALVHDIVTGLGKSTNVVMLNCVSLAAATDVYGKILASLPGNALSTKGRKLPKASAEQTLLSVLSSPGQDTVIVLDEVDGLLLSSVHQDVLYKIFMAVNSSSSLVSSPKASIIGIANSLDLADKFLPILAAHDASPKLLSFSPFQPDDIIAVVKARLQGLQSRYDGKPVPKDVDEASTTAVDLPIFSQPGLRLAAMKVAAVTGDLRKALDVCRLAVETMELQQIKKGVDLTSFTPLSAPRVGPPQVLSAVSRALATAGASSAPAGATAANIARIRSLPLHAGLLLAAHLLSDFKQRELGGIGSMDIATVYDTYVRVLADDGTFSPLSLGEVLDVFANLETQAFLDLTAPRTSITPGQAKGASRAALKALAKRVPGSASAPALGARSRVISLRIPAQDVRRALTEVAPSHIAGSGKTVAAESIARIIKTEEKRVHRAKGWEQSAIGFAEMRQQELGGGRLAIAQGL